MKGKMTCPHCQQTFGYAGPGDYCPNRCPRCGANLAAPLASVASLDISSGLGIGGAGADDYNIHTEADCDATRFVERRGMKGQLWEPCPVCKREPVHLDCGYCDKHCRCGG